MATSALHRAGLFVALWCAMLVLGPAAAQAAGTEVVTIGPIAAGNGYSAEVLDTGCGTASNQLSIRYTTGESDVGGIAHVYDGPAGSCSLPSGGHPGALRASWPGVAKLALRLTRSAGSAGNGLPLDCGGTVTASHAALAAGTLKLAIHPGAFGRVSTEAIGAGVQAISGLNCGASVAPETHSVTLVATTLDQLLIVQQPSSGQSVLALVDFARDVPAPGVVGQMIVALEGWSDVFQVGPLLTAARIGSVSPFTAGSLWFTALPACLGHPGALNGVLTGKLTVKDAVFGAVTFTGTATRSAAIEAGSSTPGTCNGLGIPL